LFVEIAMSDLSLSTVYPFMDGLPVFSGRLRLPPGQKKKHVVIGISLQEKIANRLREEGARRGIKAATRAKIAQACIEIVAQTVFAAALRQCGVAEPTIAGLVERHPHGLKNISPYELVDYGPLIGAQDDGEQRSSRSRSRAGLTGLEADRLAQTDYSLGFRPFDPTSLERARGFVEHAARERIELRGDIGAPIARIATDLEKRFAIPLAVSQQATALLTETRKFIVAPNLADLIWLSPEARAEAGVSISVRDRLKCPAAPGARRIAPRRIAPRATLFPRSSAPLSVELTKSQRAAAKTALENSLSIICGLPGVGKTSVLTALVEHGGSRVLISAIAAAAVQRAAQVTGGAARTIASLTAARQGA
jgi:AAA domain